VPDDPDLRQVRRDLLAAAADSYQRAASINERSGNALSGLARTWHEIALADPGERGNLDKAITFAEQALALYPTMPKANLATAQMLLDRFLASGNQSDAERARALFKKALALSADSVEEKHVKLTFKEVEQARNGLRALQKGRPASPESATEDEDSHP
jgi:tetratricopeptide (TPR) repeat protein